MLNSRLPSDQVLQVRGDMQQNGPAVSDQHFFSDSTGWSLQVALERSEQGGVPHLLIDGKAAPDRDRRPPQASQPGR